MNGQKLLFLCGVAMAGFLDFAVGALLAAVVGKLMDVPMNVWYIIIGGFIGQSPDLVEMAKARLKGKQALANGHHESWDHWPMFMMVLGTILGLIIGGGYWGIVSFLCLLFHFHHDMEIGNSGGIPFFAPFDWRFFSWWRGFYDPHTSAMHWPENELEPWIQRNWLQSSDMSAIEIQLGGMALGIACGIVIDTTLSWMCGIILFTFVLCWAGANIVWSLAKKN